MELKCHLICMLILFSILIVLPVSLSLSLGYFHNKDWNADAKTMPCSINGTDAQEVACDAGGGGGGGGGGEKRYMDYGCCQGIVIISCSTYPAKSFKEGGGICKDIKDQMNNLYPNGSSVTCWYIPSNPADFEMDLKPVVIWLVSSLIWLGLGMVVFSIWLICAIKNRNKNKYQELK